MLILYTPTITTTTITNTHTLLSHLLPSSTYTEKNKRESLPHILLQLLRLLQLRLKRKRRERPPAKLGKLGEGLDPRQTERVQLHFVY